MGCTLGTCQRALARCGARAGLVLLLLSTAAAAQSKPRAATRPSEDSVTVALREIQGSCAAGRRAGSQLISWGRQAYRGVGSAFASYARRALEEVGGPGTRCEATTTEFITGCTRFERAPVYDGSGRVGWERVCVQKEVLAEPQKLEANAYGLAGFIATSSAVAFALMYDTRAAVDSLPSSVDAYALATAILVREFGFAGKMDGVAPSLLGMLRGLAQDRTSFSGVNASVLLAAVCAGGLSRTCAESVTDLRALTASTDSATVREVLRRANRYGELYRRVP